MARFGGASVVFRARSVEDRGGTIRDSRDRMRWPRTPVEWRQDFQPRFCPWPKCAQHRGRGAGFRYQRAGHYTTRRGRRVPRFRCGACRRGFSRQTFATSYYLKRPELLLRVAAGLVAGSAHRQLARSFGCAPSTVTRMAARLGRHALLLLARALEEMRGGVGEPLVLDHFETFECCQDLPFGVATLVGSVSWFVYALDPAPHARSGRRSPVQQRRLERRPSRRRYGGYRGSASRVLEVVRRLKDPSTPLELRADDHEAYRWAATRHEAMGWLRLRSFPNPPRGPKGSPRSPEARARDNALFPVDSLHQLLRHTLAHHRRETIAFGRRLNALMERLFLTAVWRNFIKGRSERCPDRRTPAMLLGLTDTPWTWRRLLARRLFPERECPPPIWTHLYRRHWITPVLPANTLHHLSNAY